MTRLKSVSQSLTFPPFFSQWRFIRGVSCSAFPRRLTAPAVTTGRGPLHHANEFAEARIRPRQLPVRCQLFDVPRLAESCPCKQDLAAIEQAPHRLTPIICESSLFDRLRVRTSVGTDSGMDGDIDGDTMTQCKFFGLGTFRSQRLPTGLFCPSPGLR